MSRLTKCVQFGSFTENFKTNFPSTGIDLIYISVAWTVAQAPSTCNTGTTSTHIPTAGKGMSDEKTNWTDSFKAPPGWTQALLKEVQQVYPKGPKDHIDS